MNRRLLAILAAVVIVVVIIVVLVTRPAPEEVATPAPKPEATEAPTEAPPAAEGVTLGLRYYYADRLKLVREIVTISTKYGTVGVKTGRRDNKALSVKPEFEDCRRAALEHDVSIEDVSREAIRKYYEQE